MATPDPRVAVVVITHDRVAELLRTLEQLVALPERPRVVVADNASTDGTAAAVRAAFPGVVVLEMGENLGAVARNVAVGTLNEPYVAFADDDTWWDPGALARAADLLDAHPRLAVVTGHVTVEPGGRDDPANVELRESPLPRPTDVPGYPLLSFLAGASVVRRAAFRGVGGFHPRLWLGGEEALVACDLAAAGWAMAHIPDIVVHHQPSRARDAHLRRRHGIRNALWFTWLRRPPRRALWRTAHLLRRLPRDRVSAAGVADAVAGLPWVLRERRVAPAHVESGLRLLDGPQLHRAARRYVS